MLINAGLGDAGKVKEYRGKWEDSVKAAEAQLNVLSSADPMLQDDADKLKQQAEQFRGLLSAYAGGMRGVADGMGAGGDLKALYEAVKKVREPTHQLEDATTKAYAAALKEIEANTEERNAGQQAAIRWSLLVLLAAVVLGSGLAWKISRDISTPLGRMEADLEQAAAQRDLRHQWIAKAQDEIGRMTQALGSLMQALRNTLQESQRISAEVKQAAGGMSQRAGQVETVSAEQADAAASTASAVEQLSVSIRVVSDNARGVANDVEQVQHAASSGSQVATEAAHALQGIAGVVTDASRGVDQLGQRSIEIGGIAQSIKEIADQTNLLALNAAIEAARAGEQGRGFAVVADEVRKLAERTGQATNEITRIIAAVQDDTRQAVGSMQEVSSRVQHGVGLTASVADSLQQIRGLAEQSVVKASDISTAISEQGVASDIISRNVEQIASMTESNHEAMTQVRRLSDELSAQATEQDRLIAQFKI
ncbi:methyl-accepting chemotaxis protein [Leeia sp. IMCC25680]|uniref:Methyl-accepting chemotaxis protein n=2 Tax=Leeia aquatica TaxID=2725557 RepID=A0A847SGG5_9NEIS|nr:methyl-accepting chemotaxis protein [Leeia aquatica]